MPSFDGGVGPFGPVPGVVFEYIIDNFFGGDDDFVASDEPLTPEELLKAAKRRASELYADSDDAEGMSEYLDEIYRLWGSGDELTIDSLPDDPFLPGGSSDPVDVGTTGPSNSRGDGGYQGTPGFNPNANNSPNNIFGGMPNAFGDPSIWTNLLLFTMLQGIQANGGFQAINLGGNQAGHLSTCHD